MNKKCYMVYIDYTIPGNSSSSKSVLKVFSSFKKAESFYEKEIKNIDWREFNEGSLEIDQVDFED